MTDLFGRVLRWRPRLFERVVWKIWGSTLFLVLFTLIPLAVSLNSVLAGFHEKFVTDQLATWADQYARILANGAGYQTFSALQEIAQISGVDFIVVDESGQVYWSTTRSWVAVGDQMLTHSVRVALSGQSLVEITRSGARDVYLAAVPIIQQGRVSGALLLFEPATPVQQAMTSIRHILYFGAFATIALSAALAYLWSLRLSKPLIDMQRAARRMQGGDFAQRVEVRTGDEVGLLGEAINELASNLKRHRDSRREFLANVSHELRTPLSYMRGYSQALLEGMAQTPEDRQAYLAIINDEAERMGRLVEDLFDLTRLEEGRLPLEQRRFPIRQPIDRLVHRFQPRATERGVALGFQADPSLIVAADEARIEQVLVNLLDNALRHTPKGGRVDVIARARGEGVEVSIIDTGSGIPAAELPYIWERFHKVDKARVRSGGTGLGLAIVREIVRAHGGEVSATSDLGRGTTIGFTLPGGA